MSFSPTRQPPAKPPTFDRQHFVEAQICIAVRRVLGLRIDRVEPHHRLVDDLNCMSIDLIEIPNAVEERFGIDISDDEAAACTTIADYVALAIAKISAAYPGHPALAGGAAHG